jgi:hypothetical protein
MSQFADSQNLFRYQQGDSLGRSYLRTILNYPGVPVPVNYTFASDSGLIDMYVQTNLICGGHSNMTIAATLLSKTLTSIYPDETRGASATSFKLYQNYPNPFNPTTTVSYELPKRAYVSLKIFDVAGREVLTLISELQNSGPHSVQFDGSPLPSGVYYYRLASGGYAQTKSFILIK